MYKYHDDEITLATPNYASPELFLFQKVGYSSDLWALGIIIYYLFE